MRSFRIIGEGFEAHSELKETTEAVVDYEQGIARGSLATLVRQYSDGLVNLTVGNIRPKETVTVYWRFSAAWNCAMTGCVSDSRLRWRPPITRKCRRW